MSQTATIHQPNSEEPKLYVEPVPAFTPLYDYAYDSRIRSFFLWGGRGGAKSWAMSDFFASHGRTDRGNFLCTRETQNSLDDSVFGSLRQSIGRLGLPGYRITEKGMEHSSGARFVFAGLGYKHGVNVKSAEDIRRAWVEEAQQIRSESIKVLTPTVRADGSQIYYTFNRTDARDPVWELWQTHRTRGERFAWKTPDGQVLRWKMHRGDGAIGIEINFDGNPYFPDVLDQERRRDYRIAMETGRWSDYNHVWIGQPQEQGELSIITLRQVMEAAKREVSDEGVIEVGADIARGGRDRVAFYKRKGLRVISKRVYENNAESEIMRIGQTVDRLKAFIGDDKSILTKIDDTGLGGGVTDGMIDGGYNVAAVNFGARASDYDHYTNIAAELWFDFAKIIDTVSIPDDTGAMEELVGRREGRRDSRGRRTVEPKVDFHKRIGRSPDEADALLLCFYEPATVITSVPWSLA